MKDNAKCIVCGNPAKQLKPNVSADRTRLCKGKKCLREQRRLRQKLRRELKRMQPEFPAMTESAPRAPKARHQRKDSKRKTKFYGQVVD